MLHVIVFIIMVLCAMLIWEKIFKITIWGWKKLKRWNHNRKALKMEKAEVKRKSNLKKQFESKGWRVAK